MHSRINLGDLCPYDKYRGGHDCCVPTDGEAKANESRIAASAPCNIVHLKTTNEANAIITMGALQANFLL